MKRVLSMRNGARTRATNHILKPWRGSVTQHNHVAAPKAVCKPVGQEWRYRLSVMLSRLPHWVCHPEATAERISSMLCRIEMRRFFASAQNDKFTLVTY